MVHCGNSINVISRSIPRFIKTIYIHYGYTLVSYTTTLDRPFVFIRNSGKRLVGSAPVERRYYIDIIPSKSPRHGRAFFLSTVQRIMMIHSTWSKHDISILKTR